MMGEERVCIERVMGCECSDGAYLGRDVLLQGSW